MVVSEIRKARSRAIGRLHDQFVADQLPTTPFRPEDYPDSPDYNVHHVDLAHSSAEWEYSQLVLAIHRGEHDHELDQLTFPPVSD